MSSIIENFLDSKVSIELDKLCPSRAAYFPMDLIPLKSPIHNLTRSGLMYELLNNQHPCSLNWLELMAKKSYLRSNRGKPLFKNSSIRK